MSFSLINTWAVGDKFTSAQANLIATTLVKCLDKSLAGDTLSGVITMLSTSQIVANQPNNINVGGAGALTANTGSAVQATQPNAINATIAGGIAPGVAHGISDGGIVGGIVATVAGGIQSTIGGGIQPGVASGIQSNIANGIIATIGGGIATSIAAGIRSNVAGGFQLNGGTSDWLTYGSSRPAAVMESCGAMLVGPAPSNWTIGSVPSDLIKLAVSSDALPLLPRKLINGSVNGATLQSIVVCMSVGLVHSGTPATPPTVSMTRRNFANGSPSGTTSMFAAGAIPFWPSGVNGGIATPSGSTWGNGFNVWRIIFLPDTVLTIDTTQYAYNVSIVDEQGANSQAGNIYYGVEFVFTGIVNNAP